MSDEKILQRIRKLLAMADQTVSPEEAVVAAQKARKLMDEHNLTRDDIPDEESEFARRVAGHPFKAYPIWMQTIAIYIADYNDCVVDYESTGYRRGDPRYIRFSGFKADAIIAGYMFNYLTKNGERLAKAESRQSRGQFLTGYATGLALQIKEVINKRKTEQNANVRTLIIDRQAIVKSKFKGARQTRHSTSVHDKEATRRGGQAGYSANLNQQVSGSSTAGNIGG